MSLRAKFIWFLVIIHLVEVGLVVTLYQYDKTLFVIGEVVIVVSFLISIVLYKSFLRPHRLLMAGAESLKDQDFSIKVRNVGQRDLDNVINVFNKMFDQLRSERIQLTERNFFLDKLVENSSSGIVILDFHQKVNHLNSTALRMLDVRPEEANYKTLDQVNSKLAHQLIDIPLNESQVIQIDGIRQYKCTKLSFQERGAERFFFHLDELTEELIKVEKASYEKVIRVMAHEVNNTIGAVNSVLNSALRFEQELVEVSSPRLIEGLRSSKERNEVLNTFMKNYADVVKLPSPTYEPIDLRDLIHRTRVLFEPVMVEKRIEWIQELPVEPLIVNVDPSQIEAVFSNVVKNGIESIENGGWIKVIVDHSRLQIMNNGTPITEQEQQKIFEAFYTSKPNGQGIGLTLTKEILMNHGFDFSLATDVEGVTTFEVLYA